MTRYRFALMAGLLALGVAACGDDVEVVSPAPPAPPPPPPVTATMAPASASVAVGNSVVFAVNASGGVAGEAASWTCSSSNTGIATVSSTSAGCQATGVVAGSVTITAAVSKSGETVNVGSELTVTSDEVVGGGGDPAFVVISSIGRLGQDGVSPAESFAKRLDVGVNIERGDQTLETLSLLVDGEVVATQQLGGGAAMQAIQADGDEPAEQAPQTFTLTFDTAEHDATTGVPRFLNGDHDLSAELQIAGGMMADGMMGHEIVHSNVQTVKFNNKDGVRIVGSAPGDPVMNPHTGDLWYGGPDARDLAITAVPVIYTGRSVESVTILTFCDADAASDDSAPYEFALECDTGYMSPDGLPETPRFTMVTAGESRDDVAIVSNGVFPIRLDYDGPDGPRFTENPNDREDGWINATVELLGRQHSRNNPDGWILYPPVNEYEADETLDDGTEVEEGDYRSHGNESDYADPGVGGFIPQLRYSADDPARVNSARSAVPSSAPTLPGATEDNDDICFIVTAVDLLGNESGRPSTTSGSSRSCGSDTSLPGRSIRAGVDVTAPTAEFARSGLDEDARELDDDFVVNVEDERDGSGINEGDPFIASFEIRDAEEIRCIIDGEPNDSARLCDDPFAGLAYDDGLVSTVGTEGLTEYTGYYTLHRGRRTDKAGNLSEEISRVALSDIVFDARASVRVTQSRTDEREFSVDVTVDDDLSVRDGYLAMDFGADFPITGAPTVFRLGDAIQVDPYNSPILNTDLSLSLDIELPFLGLATAAGAPDASVQSIDAYVRDQSSVGDGAYEMDVGETGITIADDFQEEAADNSADLGDEIPGGGVDIELAFTPTQPTDGFDENDDITLTATVTTAVAGASNLPFKRVYFYAESAEGNGAAQHWRLIDSLGKAAYEETATATEFTYEIEIEGGDLYAIVDDDGEDDYTGNFIAIGVMDDTDAVVAAAGDDTADPVVPPTLAVRENIGVVGMVSDDTVEIEVEEP